MNATPIERVASPEEFERLLAALPLDLALPYALAGYGMGRRTQIIRLRWKDVDMNVGAIEWGVEWEARKYEASRRVVPVMPPLGVFLKPLHGTGDAERGTRLPTACRMGDDWPSEHRLGCDAGAEALGESEAGADHSPGGAPYGSDMA